MVTQVLGKDFHIQKDILKKDFHFKVLLDLPVKNILAEYTAEIIVGLDVIV